MKGGVAVFISGIEAGISAGQQQLWSTRQKEEHDCYLLRNKTQTHCSIEATGHVKHQFTKGFNSALLSCHHQWSATWLVRRINRCIVRKEQLGTVNVTWECCGVKRSPGKEREEIRTNESTPRFVQLTLLECRNKFHTLWTEPKSKLNQSNKNARTHPHILLYLPLASLQPAISDPMASSSSSAQDSWSFILVVGTQIDRLIFGNPI